MSRPPLRDVTHNSYVNPDSPTDRILFYHNIGYCSETGERRIWYATADLDQPDKWSCAERGNHVGVLADPCLYRWPALRRELRQRAKHAGLVIWAEGEKDARAGGRLLLFGGASGAATSHHGGARKTTPAQAEHFRGYRGRVLIAVDWDDAGAACGLRRYELLSALGVKATLVRAADGVGGGRSSGVDLHDHWAADLGLSELVRLKPRELEMAAVRSAQSEQQGWAYGADTPPALTLEEREWVRDSPLLNGHGWNNMKD